MIELESRPPATQVDSESIAFELISQQIRTETAEADYKNAMLTREVAEIAILEYTEGIFTADKSTLDGELALAHAILNRHRIRLEAMKEQLAEAERARDGSMNDLANRFRCSDQIAHYERRERDALLEIEKVKSRTRILVEYTKPIRICELTAEVATARADELGKKAVLEFAKAKERLLAAAAAAMQAGSEPGRAGPRAGSSVTGRQSADDRVAVLLESAIPIDERICAKLNQAATEGKLSSLRQDEIRDLTRQLEAIVDEAAVERSALVLDRLKSHIHQAARAADAPAK
jgi:hypothetical protein